MPKAVGYYTNCTESHHLIHAFGDSLERLAANDKLALITTLSLWLADDSNNLTIPDTAHWNEIPMSPNLARAASIVEEIDPGDALSLIAALTEQLRDGVYAR
ncbi:hypothetical protein NC981_21550 [Leptolyngbya sp. DQ-M1]|uniref:hypothetical protein n=1 Tax=Leptolyngbya sp. DQ-M1 TaxID=2933920 RepID=UPI003296EF0F